jgi:thiamine-monophosphate kinase
MSRPDEFEIIARFFAPLALAAPGALGLSDDAALVAVEPGRQLVVTLDTIVAGVHFLADDPADSVACKLLSVNLSDLAAMGARPLAYLLSVGLPSTWDDATIEAWLSAFAAGLQAVQNEFAIDLIGGDTVAVPGPVTLTATLLGTVVSGKELRRSGAQLGDDIYVSGTIGDAVLGLRLLQQCASAVPDSDRIMLADRYRRPRPRIALGGRLSGLAHAAADISDGLVADLGHICRASGVGARIESVRVPLSAAAARVIAAQPRMLTTLLCGGDDYELVFTAAPAAREAIAEVARSLDLPLPIIGRIVPAPGGRDRPVVVVDASGTAIDIDAGGYRHF